MSQFLFELPTDHEPSDACSAGVLACEFWRRLAAMPLKFRFMERKDTESEICANNRVAVRLPLRHEVGERAGACPAIASERRRMRRP